MEVRGRKSYIQSRSGYIIEMEEGKVARRLNLKEIEELNLPDNVIISKASFYKAYWVEIETLKALHQDLKKMVNEEPQKTEPEAAIPST